MPDHAQAEKKDRHRPDRHQAKPADPDTKVRPQPAQNTNNETPKAPPPKSATKATAPPKHPPPKAAAAPQPAAPPAPVITARPPALAANAVPMPADLPPGVALRVGRYVEAVEQQKRSVQLTGQVAHDRVVQRANDRASTVNSEFATAEGALASEVARATTEIVTLDATTRGKLETIHKTRKDAVATSWSVQSPRIEKLRDTKTKEGKHAGEGRADDLDKYSERNAKDVETTSAKNAARATEIGKTKAAAYKDESRHDDIEDMATDMAKETADKITVKSTKTAKSIRDDSKQVVDKLREAGCKLEAELSKQGPEASHAVDTARDDANKGLDDLLAKALPDLDQMSRTPLEQLPRYLTEGTAELERLRVAAIGAISKSTEHLLGALEIGGRQRIDDLDRVAHETLSRTDELHHGDPQAIDDALTEQELGFCHAGDLYANEIVVGRDRGIGEIDRLATLGTGAAATLINRMVPDVGSVVTKVRKPYADVVVPVERESDKLRDEAVTKMTGFGDKLEKTYDDAIKKVDTELEPQLVEAKATVDKKVNEVLPPQEEDLKKLGETIDSKAKELIEESRVWRFFKSIGSFLLSALEFIVGFLLGVLWAVVKFIIGLVVLILAIVLAIFALVFAAIALFLVLVVLLGSEIAALVVAIVVAIVVAVIAIVAIIAIVVGILYTLYTIVMGIWRAITGKGLSPFQRGFLTGESVGDLVLLLLPFKAKVPGLRAIPFPKWMPSFLVGEHPGIPPETPEVPLGDTPVIDPVVDPIVEPPKVEQTADRRGAAEGRATAEGRGTTAEGRATTPDGGSTTEGRATIAEGRGTAEGRGAAEGRRAEEGRGAGEGGGAEERRGAQGQEGEEGEATQEGEDRAPGRDEGSGRRRRAGEGRRAREGGRAQEGRNQEAEEGQETQEGEGARDRGAGGRTGER